MIASSHHRPVHVLIIDDDFHVRDALEMFVRNQGCHCVGIPSAEEALSLMAVQSYDIVVCDYRLPGLDGLAFFQRIHQRHPDPVKILISAYGSPQLTREAVDTGVDAYFQKPFGDGKIEATLRRMIENAGDHALSRS